MKYLVMYKMHSQKIISTIKESIEELCSTFESNPDIFLTENDVKAFLYHLLLKKSTFCNLVQTRNGTKTYSVHTEIRFYGGSDKLKYLSDIVILDPTNLSTKEGGSVKINSKGFSFNRYYVIIEIKLQRTTYKKNLLKELNKDIDRINQIVDSTFRNNLQTKFYFVYLDRKENIQEKITRHFQEKGLSEQYQLFYKGRRNHCFQPPSY